jgi:hypothetical protein
MSKKEKKVDVVTNKKFAEQDEIFKKACDVAGIKPTKRQASKFRLGKGLAFESRNKQVVQNG